MKIAVYCGSSTGKNTAYAKAAYELGKWIGSNGHEMIYGASNTGLMGAVAEGALDAGGTVTGIVPDVPVIKGRVHPGITNLVETDTIAERKARMIAYADAYIALPGGLGTLDEITEVLSLESLDLVRGPIIFYSVDGYYEPMRKVLDNILQNGFGEPAYFLNVFFAETLTDIAGALSP